MDNSSWVSRSTLLLSLGALCLPSCEFNCSVGGDSSKKLASKISESLSEQLEVDVQITCPDIEPDGITQCSGKIADGTGFIIEAKKNDEGTFDWETKGVLMGKKLEARIVEVYRGTFQVVFDKVSCPTLILGQKDARVTCTAQKQDVTVTLEVTLAGDTVDDVVPTSGVVISSKVVALAQDMFHKQGMAVKVDCGLAFRISVPGQVFTCMAADTLGQEVRVYVKITSTDGQVSMQTQPF